ncbi:aminoglycoside resistance [Desulfofustis phage LS06-2018-MD01]|jgi:hypothetical protein|nr:aminoglycoside resistance [Desulfofustis phage LS06-2018-MD01]
MKSLKEEIVFIHARTEHIKQKLNELETEIDKVFDSDFVLCYHDHYENPILTLTRAKNLSTTGGIKIVFDSTHKEELKGSDKELLTIAKYVVKQLNKETNND